MKGQFSSEGDSANGHQLKSDVFDRADKHTRSEERRIQSLLQKRELERKRQCLVSDTLKKIDSAEGTGLNKKIRFDSDSDNDDNDDNGRCAPTTATTSKSALANGSTSNGTITSASTSTSKTKKPALFDDDEEDDEQNGEDAEADGEMFALKPHFFGKKGAELMALEARYGGDDRFKLSNKFVEEGDEPEEPQDEEQVQRQQEKKNALGILERVLGHNLRSNKHDEEATVSTSAATRPLIVRFDPNNPEHERYDLAKPTKPEDSSSSDEDDEETAGKVSNSQEPVAKKPKHVTSYHMDADFAEALRARLAQSADAEKDQPAQPFSLLSSLGRQQPPDSQANGVKPEIPSATQAIPKLEKWQTLKSHLADSSDEEGYADPSISQRNISSKTTDGSSYFFLDADDPIVAKTVQRFRRTEDIEIVKKKWSKFRESIVKCYKKQKKLAVRTAKTKERALYRSNPGQSSDSKPARESSTFPRRPTAVKQPQPHQKNPTLKAKRLAKKKRRIATKKATTEPVSNGVS